MNVDEAIKLPDAKKKIISEILRKKIPRQLFPINFKHFFFPSTSILIFRSSCMKILTIHKTSNETYQSSEMTAERKRKKKI